MEVLIPAKRAVVTLNADERDAVLLLAVYTQDLQLAEVREQAVSGGETQEVSIQFTKAFPENFHLHAMLVDRTTYAPLCAPCTEYSESVKLTIHDYEEDRILNFDEQDDQNFAALAKGVIVLRAGEDFSCFETEDEVNFTLYDVTSRAKGRLTSGAKVILLGGESSYPVMVASAAASGSTVTLNGQEPDGNEDENFIGEFFDYLTIDQTIDRLDTEAADWADGVTLAESAGLMEDENEKSKIVLSFDIDGDFGSPLHVNGHIDSELSGNIIFIYKEMLLGEPYTYYNVSIEADHTISLGVKASKDNAPEGKPGQLKPEEFEIPLIKEIPIPTPYAKLLTEGTLAVTIPFKVELAGSLELKTELHSQWRAYGENFLLPIVENDITFENFSVEASVEFTLDVGLRAKVTFGVVKKAIYLEVGAQGGLEGTFTLSKTLGTIGKKRHLCTACAEGELVWYIKGWFEVGSQFGKRAVVIFRTPELAKEWPAKECYISLYEGRLDFGWGECLHIGYLSVFTAQDSETYQELTGASISVKSCADSSTVLIGKNGVYDYLPAGEYEVTAKCDGYNINTERCTVSDEREGNGARVYLTPYDGDPNEEIHGGGATGTFSNGVAETYKLYPDGYFYGAAPRTASGMLTKAEGSYTWHFNGKRNSIVHIDLSEGVFDSVGAFAFRNCPNLVRVDLDPELTRILRYAFENCRKLETINIPSGAQIIGEYAFRNCSNLRSPLRFGDVHISQYAFADCSSLPSLSVGAGTIDASAFSNCTSLESVALGDIGTIADSAFVNCPNLSQVALLDGITAIGNYAFGSCASLQSIILPRSVETLGTSAFGQSGITSLTIPGTVRSMGKYLAANCTALKTVALEEGITEIPAYAFGGCRPLNRVSLPGSLTAIGSEAFREDINLEEITIPGSVTDIGESVFYNCVSLSRMTLSPGVSTIGTLMFSGCGSLREITIPASVTSIGNNAFERSGLQEVYYQGTEAQWNEIAIGQSAIGSNVTVHFIGE